MGTINRKRTIRPSTRKASSRYRVKIGKPSVNDVVIVTVNHESEDFLKEYRFSGNKIANRDSIYFDYVDGEVVWSPVVPD